MKCCIIFLRSGNFITTAEMNQEDIDSLVTAFKYNSQCVVSFNDTEGETHVRPSDISSICVNDFISSRGIGIKGGESHA